MICREGSCNHYTGTQHETCAAGIRYADVTVTHDAIPTEGAGRATRSMPCVVIFNAAGVTCAKREFPTAEQIEATKRETDRRLDCYRRGVSACCEVPLNESRVITSGRHKGHGPRYCSKCGKLAFVV